MRLPSRTRASGLLLAVLLGALLAAGTAAAAGLEDAGCCCPERATAAGDCVFLGTADCCPERPSATSSNATATYDAPPGDALALPALARAVAPTVRPAPPALRSPTRTVVLRL